VVCEYILYNGSDDIGVRENMEKIILFDGDCHFCDASVQFIIKRDPKGRFKFASLQSESGIKLLKQHQIPTHMDSFLYIDGDKWYSKSTAALKVAKHLRGCVKLSYPLIIVPRLIRDFFYNIISKNRYKWFGKKDHCTIPTQNVRKRFL